MSETTFRTATTLIDQTRAERPRRRTAARWAGSAGDFVLRLALAGVFIFSGSFKLSMNEMSVAGFADLGGVPMLILVGLLEVAGGVGLLVPILSGFAAIGLSALLVIITVVSAVTMGAESVALPACCLVVASVLVYLRRRQTVRMARFVRRIVRPATR